MLLLWTIVGIAGHALAAALLASLTILTSRRAGRRSGRVREEQLLVVALAVTALWSLRHALGGVLSMGPLPDGVSETVRNGAWLALLGCYLQRSPGASSWRRGRPLIVLALALLLIAQLCFDLLVGEGVEINAKVLPVLQASWLTRCLFALGALVLLHSLSERRDHPGNTPREAWVGGALAFMWAYDVNHYFLSWFTNGDTASIGPMRGFVMALLAIMLAIGLRSDGKRAFALSRAMTIRLVSLGILALYLFVVALMVILSGEMVSPFGRVAPFAMLFAFSVSVMALMPAASFRSWLRIEISKHLFTHRYDYRALWLRFAAAVAENMEDEASLDARLTRAIAEAVDVPAAVLFLRDGSSQLVPTEAWNWEDEGAPLDPLDSALADRLEQSGWILDIAADWRDYGPLLPTWMERSPRAWAIAPLIHREQLLGVILLSAPRGGRGLDWEDLDVLRVVCGEAAARISEARNRVALAEAQRFDEFNRRFAFILHDLKNLVSQMLLLASNAERHADNPAFRADMVLTLKETATRMTELLQRLGRPGSMAGADAKGLALGAMMRALAPRWAAGLGQVEVEGDVVRLVRADADGLSRAIGHLVRNGIEASPAGSPVVIRLAEDVGAAIVEIVDQGRGMSADFIAHDLFRPFSSTKSNGFGLGAHEARLLVQGMGGTLEVESEEGRFTRFTIKLPFADRQAAEFPLAISTRKTG